MRRPAALTTCERSPKILYVCGSSRKTTCHSYNCDWLGRVPLSQRPPTLATVAHFTVCLGLGIALNANEWERCCSPTNVDFRAVSMECWMNLKNPQTQNPSQSRKAGVWICSLEALSRRMRPKFRLSGTFGLPGPKNIIDQVAHTNKKSPKTYATPCIRKIVDSEILRTLRNQKSRRLNTLRVRSRIDRKGASEVRTTIRRA